MSNDAGVKASVIYKICRIGEWEAAMTVGRYAGSADDLRDGFIHLSTAAQLAETARRYFSNQSDLLLIAFDVANFAAELKWEPSRGGALFPHVYADLPVALAVWTKPIKLDAAGVPLLPEGIV